MKIELGLLPLLTIIMAILKLTHVISISWWVVFIPVLVPMAVCFCVLIIFAIGYAIGWTGWL